MHFHGQTHLDIRLARGGSVESATGRKAQRHRFAPQAGYVTFIIHSREDVAVAKELIELSYENAREIMGKHSERRSNASKPPVIK